MSQTAEAQAHSNAGDDPEFDFDIKLDGLDLEKMQAGHAAASTAPKHDADELRPEDLGGLNGLTGLEGMDALDNLTAADHQDDEPAHEDAAPSRDKSKLWIALAIAGIMVVVILFGFFAAHVLGGKSKRPNSAERGLAAEQQTLSAGSAADAPAQSQAQAGQDPALTSLETAKALDSAFNAPATPKVEPAAVNPVAQAADPKNLVVTYDPGQNTAPSPAPVPQPKAAEAPAKQGVELTEEEKMYDGLLNNADGMNVPPEAIKIDDSVVKRKLESQRLTSISQELKDARDSVAQVKSAVEGLQTQLNGYSQLIEKSAADQAKINDSITKLAETVANASTLQDQKMNELKAAVAEADKRAKNAEAVAAAAKDASQKPATREVVIRETVKPAPAPAPVAKPTAPVSTPAAPVSRPADPRIENMVASLPQPKAVAAPVLNDAPEVGMPAHCNGSRVSTNWKVKGVGNQSAYIARPQDNQGLYLKIGMDVPGYGKVQAFDPISRAVCTTSGLIRR
ncbi:hypothetical protein [Pseudomonas sp.]|uniref:hypothetical protein n=1 Tax=Pseudomonas sp. TaxID=306 RepID=UPI00290BC07B|nr:hypothetical protein [Pseudomonas sp.]MDU4254462.1 hypothetical protein [Pseudomonas sp.]